LDVIYFPTVFTYLPARTRAVVLLGVHDVIAETFSELVFPNGLHRRLWECKGRLGRRQAHTIVTVSDYAAKGIAERFNWPADGLWVVDEAPDPLFKTLPDPSLAQETLRRYGLAPPARYVICLGGLNPHKNVGMLLEVLADLRCEPAFADLRLALVGPAEEDTFTPGVADVRRRVIQLGLENSVLLTGYLPDEEVRHLLSYAELLALPSLMEGYGLAAVEAAVCGIPVAATRNSPLSQLLEGGGFFLDPGQPAAWHDAIAALLYDDERRKEMGAAARRCAAALSWEQSADRFVMLLDRLRDELTWTA
jgi:glycosyltransferase involved in cell wall biosynthesis